MACSLSVPPRSVDHHRLAGTDRVQEFGPFLLAVDQFIRPFHRPAVEERIALIVHACRLARSNVLFGSAQRARTRVAKVSSTPELRLQRGPANQPGFRALLHDPLEEAVKDLQPVALVDEGEARAVRQDLA
jgi:hypothetical protein